VRILFFSDLHASIRHGLHGPAFIAQIRDTFKWIRQAAVDYQVDYIIFLGDLFDVQSSVDTPSLHVCVEGFREVLEAAPVIVVEGNHDTYYKDGAWTSIAALYDLKSQNGVHSLALCLDESRMELRDKAGAVYPVCAYPYRCGKYSPGEFLFTFGHLPVSGAIFTPQGRTDNGVDSNFSLFPSVARDQIVYIGGHYHHPQITGRSLIVGACCYHSYSDQVTQTPRGAVVLTLPEPRVPVISDFFWLENPYGTPVCTIRVQNVEAAKKRISEIREFCRIPVEQWHIRIEIPSSETETLVASPEFSGVRAAIVPDDPPRVLSRTSITSHTAPLSALQEYMQQVPPAKMAESVLDAGKQALEYAEKTVTEAALQ
jgi:hypothetical protein